eukprot:7333076-Pyramimonas_sp.AAC.1
MLPRTRKHTVAPLPDDAARGYKMSTVQEYEIRMLHLELCLLPTTSWPRSRSPGGVRVPLRLLLRTLTVLLLPEERRLSDRGF